MVQRVDENAFFDPHSGQPQTGREVDSPVLPVNHVLSAMTYAHSRSPINEDHGAYDKYLEHAKTIAAASLAGGVTAHPAPNRDGSDATLPVGSTQWYGVGGAHNENTGRRQEAWKVPANVDQKPTAFAHTLNTEANKIARSDSGNTKMVGAGGWSRDAYPDEAAQRGEQHLAKEDQTKTIVYDQTDVVPNRRAAVKMGRARREDAIFDAKNIEEISTKRRFGWGRK